MLAITRDDILTRRTKRSEQIHELFVLVAQPIAHRTVTKVSLGLFDCEVFFARCLGGSPLTDSAAIQTRANVSVRASV